MYHEPIIVFLLVLIALKLYEDDINKSADILFAFIVLIFKGMWKIIKFPLKVITFPFLIILGIICTAARMWRKFDRWMDQTIEKINH